MLSVEKEAGMADEICNVCERMWLDGTGKTSQLAVVRHTKHHVTQTWFAPNGVIQQILRQILRGKWCARDPIMSALRRPRT